MKSSIVTLLAIFQVSRARPLVSLGNLIKLGFTRLEFVPKIVYVNVACLEEFAIVLRYIAVYCKTKQDRQCTNNVALSLGHVHTTIFAVEKQ